MVDAEPLLLAALADHEESDPEEVPGTREDLVQLYAECGRPEKAQAYQ